MRHNTFNTTTNGLLSHTCYYAPDWNCWLVVGNFASLTICIWMLPGGDHEH
jgi:hypothetical protein